MNNHTAIILISACINAFQRKGYIDGSSPDFRAMQTLKSARRYLVFQAVADEAAASGRTCPIQSSMSHAVCHVTP